MIYKAPTSTGSRGSIMTPTFWSGSQWMMFDPHFFQSQIKFIVALLAVAGRRLGLRTVKKSCNLYCLCRGKLLKKDVNYVSWMTWVRLSYSYLLTCWFRVLYCNLHFAQVIGKLLSLGDGMQTFTEVIKLIYALLFPCRVPQQNGHSPPSGDWKRSPVRQWRQAA